jgi:hypothetical protein
MAQSTMVEQGTTEQKAVASTQPKPETWITTLIQGEITKIEQEKKGRFGVCRITVLAEATGRATSPPMIVLYVRDGGEPDAGYTLRADESRRCKEGLGVGDVIRVEGRVAVSRQKARAQEVIVTEQVKLMWDASDQPEEDTTTSPMPSTLPLPSRPASRRPTGSPAHRSGGSRHDRPRVVLFSGSRDWGDAAPVMEALDSLPEGSLVIEGGARGLDAIVREEAPKRGLHVATVRALWGFFDKPAGYRRNEAMLMLQPEELFAYPLGDSPGTRHMIRAAEAESIAVREG